ncbi:transglutaminase family protein [Frankia sp. R82]|uniref:transglutaminase-like domain-containing protein n=1 Tax=Frankia sp. R82 TaxID=2950553 RepID=UPI00204453E8|nr:transglutaminase family protein [Frankia sp. R82]MCM3883857.1 transglutaminase family protein [Frankia sp. R82]
MTSAQPAGHQPPPQPGGMAAGRVVSCELTLEVSEPAELAVHIVAAGGRVVRAEHLAVTLGGEALPAPAELTAPHRGRLHVLRTGPGLLSVSYRAELAAAPPGAAGPVDHPDLPGSPSTPSPPSAPRQPPDPRRLPDLPRPNGPEPLPDLEQLTYLRASRYCPSDQVVGFAVAEFGALPAGRPQVEAITRWINSRVGYVPGASNVHSSATDALLTGQGVCRDFAHLGITLCRALQIPARFTAVYAPGLTPMDFHAVFEAFSDGAWWACDATGRAPRQGMVRIATGRDAADTAFLNVLRGIVALRSLEVTATVTGALPLDDGSDPQQLG